MENGKGELTRIEQYAQMIRDGLWVLPGSNPFQFRDGHEALRRAVDDSFTQSGRSDQTNEEQSR